MVTKNLFGQKLGKWKQETEKAGKEGISGGTVLTLIEGAIHFLLAATLSGGVVFGSFAPFGVAMVAGSGAGLYGGLALLGSGMGYLLLLGFSDGLRYLSAAVLTFAVAFAFHDVRLMRRSMTMPLLGGMMNAVAGFIYLSGQGWTPQVVIFFFIEFLMTVGAGWACHTVLLPAPQTEESSALQTQRKQALVILSCIALASLAGITVVGTISLGRSIAVTLILAVCARGGVAPGAVIGVATGLMMDMAAMELPVYAMAFGAAALAAGMVKGSGRVWTALAYILGNGVSVLWLWDKGLPLSVLYEVFLGTVLFMLLPQGVLARLDSYFLQTKTLASDGGADGHMRKKVESASAAFRSLSEAIRAATQPPENDNDVAGVFDRAASKVCKGCSMRGKCWEREYAATFNALNDATSAMLERGSSNAADYPKHFSERCLHFRSFVTAVNQELTALLYRRQYNHQIRESRAAVMRQYGQLSGLLGDLAAEMGDELTPAPTEEKLLRRHMAAQGLDGEIQVSRDARGLLRVRIQGDGLETLTRPRSLAELGKLLQAPLNAERDDAGITLLQQEPLMAVAGVAARKKDGETVSGDAGTYFKREDGKLYLLICDGMGSGEEAHRESTMAVRLLEQFLRAGIGAEQALVTLSTALGLRGEVTGGFSTIDLLELDLFTGQAELLKLGAAPSYIKRNGGVGRITSSNLPAGMGINEPSVPDRTRVRLSPGDCILMISDGVANVEDDQWLRDRFAAFDGESPKELACQLIDHSPSGATDDRTALVVRLEKRT